MIAERSAARRTLSSRIRAVFARGNVLTTLLAASVLPWRRHPATWKGNLFLPCNDDGVADDAARWSVDSWPISSCKNLDSEPGRTHPRFCLPDPTPLVGSVATADGPIIEIQNLMEQGDAATLAQVDFFRRMQPRLSPSGLTLVIL
jgi:hypothetical protein